MNTEILEQGKIIIMQVQNYPCGGYIRILITNSEALSV